MTRPNFIAAIVNVESVDSQVLLHAAVDGWCRAGVKVAGVIASSRGLDEVCSAGTLRDIASGREYSVALDAAPEGSSCHLDYAGMEAACAGLMEQVRASEVIVLSKFGKLEAMQRGLWAAFAAAMAGGKPLLTTVSPKHLDSWTAFAGDFACLAADARAIEAWWVGIRQAAAPEGRRG